MKILFNKLLRICAKSFFGVIIYKLYKLIEEIFNRFMSHAAARVLFPNAVDLSIDSRAIIKYPENITLGTNIVIGSYCQIGAMNKVIFGDFVRVSKGVIIETAGLDLNSGLPYKHKSRPIKIGRAVWLGSNCIILGGVEIGDNSIIGAGTVVSKNVPPNTIVVGMGAKFFPKNGDI